MIKARNNPVGKCPDCNSDLFEEEIERNNGDPNHEMVWYEKIIVCADCNYQTDYECYDD